MSEPRPLRGLLFGAIAIALVIAYGALGSRLAPFLPSGTPTPTPTKPVQPVEAPRVGGTLAFALRGDVYVLSEGRYVARTSDGRSSQPNLSGDGRTLLFVRREAIDGKRDVDGQVTPAILRYSDVIRLDTNGNGGESIVLSGLRTKAASGFHVVSWFDAPAIAPDGRRFAVTSAANGVAELELYDLQTGRRSALLSQGSTLADPAWSPDGRTIAVTSYTLGAPRILLVPADGRPATEVAIKGVKGEPYRPSFSPDGKWIIYTLRQENRNDVHAVEIATGVDLALTADGRSWNAVFSPDGRQIAFLRETAGVIDLYAMEVADPLIGGAAKAAVKLTRGEGIDGESRPAWGR